MQLQADVLLTLFYKQIESIRCKKINLKDTENKQAEI